MVLDQLTLVHECVVMKFMATESSKPAEIHYRLSFVFIEWNVVCLLVLEWCKYFKGQMFHMDDELKKKVV